MNSFLTNRKKDMIHINCMLSTCMAEERREFILFQDVFTSSLDGLQYKVLMIVERSKLEGENHNTNSQILYGRKLWQALTLAKLAKGIWQIFVR